MEENVSCPHFGSCGGCTYRDRTYEEQLALKEEQVRTLLQPFLGEDCVWEAPAASPQQEGYRNKMEFSFGDAAKDGPLELGFHRKGSFYDILTVDGCRNMDEDYRRFS